MIDILKKISNEIYIKLEENDPGLKLVVYMDNDFYLKMLASVYKDGFESLNFNFGEFSTIMGYQVYRVIPHHTREKEIRHPDYEILIIEE